MRENIMSIVYVLEWTFSPPDYFEEPIQISRDQYEMQIDNGKVEARVDAEYYEQDNTILDQLYETLSDRFLAEQFLSHKHYELSIPGVYRLHPDGHKDLSRIIRDTVGVTDTIDITLTDENGNITADTRRDRIEKQRLVVELIAKYRQDNPIVASLLNSYHSAVRNPENELVYLYEVRDALNEKFKKDGVLSICDISPEDWSDFGNLANSPRIRQGRHRGKGFGFLRDATNQELQQARAFSRKLILGYLEYLDGQ